MSSYEPGRTICEHRNQVEDEMDKAASNYSRAARQLSVTMGIMDATAYNLARAAADLTRRDAEKVRHILQKHRREHGC
jgi:hypothetical protein